MRSAVQQRKGRVFRADLANEQRTLSQLEVQVDAFCEEAELSRTTLQAGKRLNRSYVVFNRESIITPGT